MKKAATVFPFIINPYDRDESRKSADSAEQPEKSFQDLGRLITKLEMLLLRIETRESDSDAKSGERKLESFFKAFIPIMDILDSIKSAIRDAGDTDWIRGFESFYEKLLILFSKYDLVQTAKHGAAFDPALHEAAGAKDSPDVPDGSIAEVIRSGWIYRGKILRFAQVIVSRKSVSGR